MMKKKKETKDVFKIHEVAIVYRRPLLKEMPKIKSSADLHEMMKKIIDLERIDYCEFFHVILLTNSNNVLGVSEIGKGDATGVVVNIKEIFQLVIKSNATAFVLCHNHPSGQLIPSESDKAVTENIKKVSELLSITLLDHLIITSQGYYSFADSEIL